MGEAGIAELERLVGRLAMKNGHWKTDAEAQ
jgi:hypothetical protein